MIQEFFVVGFGLSKVVLLKDKLYYYSRFPPPGQVCLMEKDNCKMQIVELANSFEAVWNRILGKVVELETDSGTPFVVKAKMAKRRGSSTLEEVLVFLKNGKGRIKECSRCYLSDWAVILTV